MSKNTDAMCNTYPDCDCRSRWNCRFKPGRSRSFITETDVKCI